MQILIRQKRPCSSFTCSLRKLSSGIADWKPILEERVWVGSFCNQEINLLRVLQICARNSASMEGKVCHGQIILTGLQTDTLTSNMIMNMYSKCGLTEWARKVFDRMPERTVVSWNTMIGSLTRNGEEVEALNLFIQMQREYIPFSEFTLSSVICACAAKLAVSECKQLHAFALKAAINSNVFVGTAIIDVYSKCYLIKDASKVFEHLNEKSEVTWSSMVAGYVENELYEEALILFQKAQMINLEHNQFMISSALSACAGLAGMIEGKQVHAVLCKTGFGSNIFVGSSLVDMYSKSGSIEDAYIAFSSVDNKNAVVWNSIISGFSRQAQSLETMILFEKMQQIGMRPDEITYVSVLSACSHMGLVESGRRYFDLMVKEHKLLPNIYHYSCMVDILGRSGLIFEAKDLIETMPFDATASIWGSLLASCRVYGNVDVAEFAAKHLFKIEPENAGNYVLLSNVYAANKKWEEVANSRKVLKDSEAKKERGKSWIEIKNKVHTFIVGERSHPRIDEIYLKLEDLMVEMKKMDYMVKTDNDLHDVDENQKKELLRHHSEKLALTFGLMCLQSGAPIRIMKNLRICGDCHCFMKLASTITKRKIIVRDVNRFHHFKNGVCSCKEFW